MTDDELLDVLRQALAGAEAQVARYRAALAALNGDDDDGQAEPVTAPSPDVPAPPVRLPKRTASPAKRAARKGRRVCPHCHREIDPRGYKRHVIKCEREGPDNAAPLRSLPKPTDPGRAGGPWTTEPIGKTPVDHDAARSAAVEGAGLR